MSEPFNVQNTFIKKVMDYGLKEGVEEICLCEACQKGYMTHPTRKTKIMFGKRYRNCVKAEGNVNEESKTIKKIQKLAKANKYGDVDGTKMNGKTANLIMKIYNHPKMKSYKKKLDTYKSHELVDMTINMSKILKIKESIYEYSGFSGMSQWQKDALAKQKGSPMKKSSPKVKKAQDAWSKKYLVKGGGMNIKKLRKDGHPPFPTDKNYNRVIKKFPFLKEDWTVNIKLKEGSCGYGIDGNLGEEPAGPHLLKKKKKKKDEASLGSMMSKKIGKHRGTRDKGEIAKILKLLVKRGNKKKDAMDMINKNYDRVSKAYRKASPAKKAEILSSLQESINEDIDSQIKNMMARRERMKKSGASTSAINSVTQMIQKLRDRKRKSNESVNERDNVGMAYKRTLAKVELKKIKDAILMFQKRIKKQGRVTNARGEEHLKNLIKVYKQMGGKGVKESREASIIQHHQRQLDALVQQYPDSYSRPYPIQTKIETLRNIIAVTKKKMGESINEDVYAIVDKFNQKKQDYDQVYFKDNNLNKVKKHMKKMGKKYGKMNLIKVKTNGKMSLVEAVSKSQAQEIMRQLGGRKFEMLMGVKSKGVGKDGLILHIGRNPKKVSHIVIDLDRGKDLYNLTFGKIFKYQFKVVKKLKGVGVEQLHDTIEKYTGLLTTFRKR